MSRSTPELPRFQCDIGEPIDQLTQRDLALQPGDLSAVADIGRMPTAGRISSAIVSTNVSKFKDCLRQAETSFFSRY